MTLNIYLFTTLVTAIKKLLLLTTNVLISVIGFVYKINKKSTFPELYHFIAFVLSNLVLYLSFNIFKSHPHIINATRLVFL